MINFWAAAKQVHILDTCVSDVALTTTKYQVCQEARGFFCNMSLTKHFCSGRGVQDIVEPLPRPHQHSMSTSLQNHLQSR